LVDYLTTGAVEEEIQRMVEELEHDNQTVTELHDAPLERGQGPVEGADEVVRSSVDHVREGQDGEGHTHHHQHLSHLLRPRHCALRHTHFDLVLLGFLHHQNQEGVDDAEAGCWQRPLGKHHPLPDCRIEPSIGVRDITFGRSTKT